jgi:AcrR family transcriptional regulator
MPQKKRIDDQSVLEKALVVISEHGPDRFTLADVGKAVGLAPATLMQRFGSKQQLLIQAAKQAAVKLKRDLEELKGKQLSWDQELIQLLSAMPEGFGSRQDIANSLGVLKLDMVDPELHPIARHLFEALRQRIQELLQQGQSCGELEASLDIDVATWELDALRHGLVIQWTLSGNGTLQKWLEKGFFNYFKRIKR